MILRLRDLSSILFAPVLVKISAIDLPKLTFGSPLPHPDQTQNIFPKTTQLSTKKPSSIYNPWPCYLFLLSESVLHCSVLLDALLHFCISSRLKENNSDWSGTWSCNCFYSNIKGLVPATCKRNKHLSKAAVTSHTEQWVCIKHNKDLRILHNSNEGAFWLNFQAENSLVLASCRYPHWCKRGRRKVREAQVGKKTSQPEQPVGKQVRGWWKSREEFGCSTLPETDL